MSTLALGICLGLTASIAINLGNNLQSLGMAQLEAKVHAEEEGGEEVASGEASEKNNGTEEKGGVDSCQSRTWVVGTTIFLTGSFSNFAAFAFAPQSILASLEGIQFVTNVFFNKCFLGKQITWSMYVGTGMVVVGVVLTVVSASVVSTLEADVAHLVRLWQRPPWLIYLALTVVAAGALHVVYEAYLKAETAGNPLPNSPFILPWAYATFSALFGTLSVVLAKVLSELLTLQIADGTPIFWGTDAWFTYVTLVGWLAFVGVWLHRMNEALSLYDPLFIIPLLQMNFILFAIISGGIFFEEFDFFRIGNWVGFVVGAMLLFFGIYLLSPMDELVDQKLSEYEEEDQLWVARLAEERLRAREQAGAAAAEAAVAEAAAAEAGAAEAGAAEAVAAEAAAASLANTVADAEVAFMARTVMVATAITAPTAEITASTSAARGVAPLSLPAAATLMSDQPRVEESPPCALTPLKVLRHPASSAGCEETKAAVGATLFQPLPHSVLLPPLRFLTGSWNCVVPIDHEPWSSVEDERRAGIGTSSKVGDTG